MEQLSLHWSPSTELSELQAFCNGLPQGLLSSAIASLGTGLGALPIMVTGQLSDRWHNRLMSVGGGIMLASAALSLLLPALNLVGQASDQTMAGLGVGLALVLGGSLLYGLEQLIPNDDAQADHHIWLFVLAIALHHFPEGLAVGLGMSTTHDLSIAIGVGLQNLPEGLMVALALRELGYGIGTSVAMAAVSGCLEPLGGLLGGILAAGSAIIVPMAMALAAGAMLFVVWHDLLPTLQLKSLKSDSTVGLAVGLLMMTVIEQGVG